MQFKIVNTKLIKPCTPTPQNLNKYKISGMDELIPPSNIGIILFYYPILSNNNRERSRQSQLEESLAKILPHFYPLAGRYIKKHCFVDCSDQGVEFVEAEVVDEDVDFIDLVSTKETEELNFLFQSKFHQVDESPTDPLLSIRMTEFKCGGLVISISVSHRIFDASSFGTFIAAWSDANNNPGGEITVSPSFKSPLLFPGNGPGSGMSFLVPYPHILVGKMFSFNKDAIKVLKSKLTRPNYSKVRVVCAVIAKALMGVDRAKHGGKSRTCFILQIVNIRGRTIPPLPKDSCGNLVTSSFTECMSETHDETSKNKIIDYGIQELVDILGDSIDKAVVGCAEMLSPHWKTHSDNVEQYALIIKKGSSGEAYVITFTDWSKFGFYEANFGWGKPIRVGIGTTSRENNIVLMGNKEGDGIEAWVYLNYNDMPYFEQDQDIKALTT